ARIPVRRWVACPMQNLKVTEHPSRPPLGAARRGNVKERVGTMTLKSGRLQLLTPHYLRSRVLRPGLIKLSLRLGLAQQMPAWAKLQFLNAGVTPATLDEVLSRITSLESWVDEWEAMGKRREAAGALALEQGDTKAAAEHFFQASAAFNFAQYVLFIDISRKRALHESCVRAFAAAAPLFDPPAHRVEIPFRPRTIV